MNFLNYLILLFQIFSFSFSYSRTQIPIGVIFHEDSTEAEVAFRSVILHENVYYNDIEFKVLKYKVDREDSIKAEEIACELASKGVYAIFGPSSIETSKIVSSICNELGIPHILTHWMPGEEKNTTEEHQYTRNFFPENNLYAQALSKIIKDYTWKTFTLIYENNESLERLQEVLEQHEPTDEPVIIRQLPEDDDYRALLKAMQTNENHIVVDCSPDKVMQLFKQAVDLKMMTQYQSYIVTSLDSHILDFAELKLNGPNITTIRIMNHPFSSEVNTAINDWRLEEKRNKVYTGIYADRIKTETAMLYDALKMFLTSFRELKKVKNISPPTRLLCFSATQYPWNHGMEIINYLNQTTDDGMTGRIIFNDVGRRTDFYMEILEWSREGAFKKIATLDPSAMKIDYTRTEKELDTEVMQSLQNETVIVVTKLEQPWLNVKKRKEGESIVGNANSEGYVGNENYEGYAFDVMEQIAKNLHFRYDFKIEKSIGSHNKEKNEWSGQMGLLVAREAHLAICDLTITSARRQAVDFTAPFMTLGISILFLDPHKEKSLFEFMSPMSLEVWLLTATAYLCISVVMFLLAKTANDDWENPNPYIADPDELENIWNMHNCIWLSAGSIMQQGCDILPKAISTRLTAGLWWFFALIVISSYTANLAATLTSEKMDASIESAEDLALQNKIKYGVMEGGSTSTFFQESNVSTFQRMWRVMQADKTVFTRDNKEGEKRVLKGKYAFLMESSSIEYTVQRQCSLTQIGGLLDSKGYGIAMPPDAPYRTLISKTVLKLQEDGVLQDLKKTWWEKEGIETPCPPKTVEGSTQALQIANVVGVFLVLAVGLGISICIGILEFLWNVSKVSVAEKITPWEAFKSEFRFAIDIRIKTKKVRKTSSEKSGSVSNRSSKSLDIEHAVVPGWRYDIEQKEKK